MSSILCVCVTCVKTQIVLQKIIKCSHTLNNRFEVDVKYNSIVCINFMENTPYIQEIIQAK